MQAAAGCRARRPTAAAVVYGVRPEHFTIADDGADAEIVVVEPTGSETQVFAKLGGEEVVAVFRERHQFNPGDKIRLKPDPRARPSVRRDDGQATERLRTQKPKGRIDYA